MTYVTKTQHSNAVKTILGAVLMTEEGAAMTTDSLAAAVGTSPSAVRRCRKTMRDFGLLARSSSGSLFNVPKAPQPTWVDFHERLLSLQDWIAFEDELGVQEVPDRIRYEVTALLDLLHIDGCLQGEGSTLLRSRLERIEALAEEVDAKDPQGGHPIILGTGPYHANWQRRYPNS